MFTRSNTEHSFYGTNIKINDQIINFPTFQHRKEFYHLA